MKHVKFLIGIIIVLVVIILIVENHEAFSTKVIFKVDAFSLHYRSAEISMYYIVTIAFLFGVLITGLYGIVERFRLKGQIKNLKKSSMEKDKELNSLRNLPITSDNVVTGELGNNYK